MPDPDDIDTDPAMADPLTPCETPDAKRKSGEFEARECPKCGGALVPCSLCEGRRTVGLSVAVTWNVEHGE
jgi:hypothetical protein